jgi:hypothetical protein
MLKTLEELNRLQRKGIDQTVRYKILFGGNKRVVEMAKIDAVKQKVQKGRFYLSKKKSNTTDEYLVIDMFKGQVYKINSEHYTIKVVEDNFLVKDNITGEEQFLILKGKLVFGNVKHLGLNNYTYFSGKPEQDYKGIPAVRFNNNFSDSIRVHWIIALMHWGIEVMNNCVGNVPIHTLLHKVSYKKSKDNSITNLQVLGCRDKDNPFGDYEK